MAVRWNHHEYQIAALCLWAQGMEICESDTIQCIMLMSNILSISLHRCIGSRTKCRHECCNECWPFVPKARGSRERSCESSLSIDPNCDPNFQPSCLSPFILEGSAAVIAIRTVINYLMWLAPRQGFLYLCLHFPSCVNPVPNYSILVFVRQW